MIRFIANTFITHFRKIITLLNQLLITKHIDEELIFSSTQATPIWHSLYFQEWNNLSSKMDKIWFIQSSELDDYLWKLQRNQATSNPISLLIQIHTFPPSFHFSTNFTNEMRSLPASSRIAEIQTNNQSSSSNPTVSIPPCKPGSASLNQFSVCRWVLTSRWIIPSKQATETTKHFLPSLLYNFQCGIQGFNIHTHIILLPILFPFHTLQNQTKNW